MNTHNKKLMGKLLGAALLLSLGACANPEKIPAAADVAVARNAVDNASGSGAAELAPAEMASARDKMARAAQALHERNYVLAQDLATEAQADAKLAQSKANSSKASAAAEALQDDIRVLRDEVDRANKAQ